MHYHWLNKTEKNKKIITFFAGWSFDDKPFELLDCGNYDVLMFYDYNNLDYKPEVFELARNYDEKYLIAWSMGVYIASLMRGQLPEFNRKIAVNGTPYPVHEDFGIPSKVFNLTLKHVYTGLEGKFIKNVIPDENDFMKYLSSPVARSIENRAQELISLDKLIKENEIDYKPYYDLAIISDNDKIVPSENQKKCWKNRAQIKVLKGGHFPFYSFKSWEEILQCR